MNVLFKSFKILSCRGRRIFHCSMKMRVIEQVQGYDNCCNTVLEKIPAAITSSTTEGGSFRQNFRGNVIFFPGDIQNFKRIYL